MDQAKFFGYSVERLGVAEEKISVREKIVVKVLNHPALGDQIEINELRTAG